MGIKHDSFHILYSGPFKTEYVDWPNGCWSLYQIDGDQIADRIVRDELVKPEHGPAYYAGDIIARHGWPGFVGCFHSMAEVTKEIERRIAEKAD